MGSVKQETINGVKWGLLQKCTMQPMQFLFGIALARLISPREFGILGLTAIFFAVANALREAGFGSALIRKQDRTEADCSTMFWFNFAMSCLMGGILFLLAPWFADFYGEPDLLPLTRISAFMMCITCTGSVHWTLYTARRDFKTPAVVGMVITLIGMPICLYFAFKGWGIWALVIQQVATSLISLITIWIISPWRPKLIWSNRSFKELFSFGVKLSLSGLITTLYNELRYFYIGKFYSAADLGLYTKGVSLCRTSTNTLSGVLDSVTYPILVTLQNEPERLKQTYLKYIRVSTLPMLFGLMLAAVNSENIIITLYGENWLQSAIYAQIICFCFIFNPLIILNNKMYLIHGRTDITLKQEIIIRCYAVPAVCLGAYFSIEGMCYASVSIAVFAAILSTYSSTRISGISQKVIYASYFPYFLYSMLANAPALVLNTANISPWLLLPTNIIISSLIYICILKWREDEALQIITEILIEKFKIRATKKSTI